MTIVPRLLLVTDRRSARFPLAELAKRAVAGGVDAVQIREKDLSSPELRILTGLIVTAVGRDRVAINSNAEIAAEFGIHLHLPESVPLPVRAESGLTISRSVHSPAAAAVIPNWCSYAIAGHVYETPSHRGEPPLGAHGLRELVAASEAPIIAIGGITPPLVGGTVAAGAHGVAVMSYVNSSEEPERAATELRDALEKTMEIESSVTIQLNGKPYDLQPGQTVADLLVIRGLSDRLVAVERNGAIVPKGQFRSLVVEPGDVIEIAHFVGGG